MKILSSIFYLLSSIALLAQGTPLATTAFTRAALRSTDSASFLTAVGLPSGTVVSNEVKALTVANFYTNATPHYAEVHAAISMTGVGGYARAAVTNTAANTRFFVYDVPSLSASAVTNTLVFMVPPSNHYKISGITATVNDGAQSIIYLATNSAASGGSGDVTQAGLAAGSYPVANSTRFKVFTSTAETNVATIAIAKATASAGDTIVVSPQPQITATNLLKNGVDYLFQNNSLYHTNQLTDANGLALGIFDDRNQGSISSSVRGLNHIEHIATFITASGAITQTNPANASAYGPIVLTNPASHLVLESEEVVASSFGGLNNAAAVKVDDCEYSSFSFDLITDPYALIDHFAGKDEFDADVFEQSQLSGAYWKKGEMHFHAKTILVPGYCYYGSSASTAPNKPTNFYATGDTWTSTRNPPLYTAFNHSNYISWITLSGDVVSYAGNAVTIFGSQRFYLTVNGKITTTNTSSATATIGMGSSGTPLAWITSQKVESSGGYWIWVNNVTTGILDITAQEYSDKFKTMTVGFLNQGGTNIMHGGRAKVGNGVGIKHEGGKTFAENMTIDTANTASLVNYPVIVSAPGMVLKDCVLISPPGTKCINAASAQTVTVLGTVTCTGTNSPNITFVGGGTVITNAVVSRL